MVDPVLEHGLYRLVRYGLIHPAKAGGAECHHRAAMTGASELALLHAWLRNAESGLNAIVLRHQEVSMRHVPGRACLNGYVSKAVAATRPGGATVRDTCD